VKLETNSSHTETQSAPQTTEFEKGFKEAAAYILSPACYVVQQLATVDTKENAIASHSPDIVFNRWFTSSFCRSEHNTASSLSK